MGNGTWSVIRETRRTAYALLGALAAAGSASCFDPVPPGDGARDTDSDAAGADGALTVEDARGMPWPATGVPTQPTLVLRLPGVNAASAPNPGEAVFLLEGGFDDEAADELVEDLRKPPLRAEHWDLHVPATVEWNDALLVVRPWAPLPKGAPLVLAVASWLGDRGDVDPALFPIGVTLRLDGGARVTDSWPADGTGAVPANLSFAAVRLDGTVEGADRHTALVDRAGGAVPTTFDETPCADVGWEDGVCVRLSPVERLTPGEEYSLRLRTGVLDGTGALVPEFRATFVATDARTLAPVPAPPPCAPDELSMAAGCLMADDRTLEARLRWSEPVRVFVEPVSATGPAATRIAPRGDASVTLLGLAAGSALALRIRAVGLGGAVSETQVTVELPGPMAPVTITEVRADSIGPEPHQDYVEVLNFGSVPLDMTGFSIGDSITKTGKVIASPAVVFPGERALIVSDRFDAAAPEDAAPSPGVTLLRVAGPLGTSGLSTGEEVVLRDGAGRRLSRTPPVPDTGPGACFLRLSLTRRDGADDDFAADPSGACSPGRAPSE